MKIKPSPGLMIRDPDLHDYLPPDGRDVPDSDYWHRRLRDGDVIPVKAEDATPEPAQQTKASPAPPTLQIPAAAEAKPGVVPASGAATPSSPQPAGAP